MKVNSLSTQASTDIRDFFTLYIDEFKKDSSRYAVDVGEDWEGLRVTVGSDGEKWNYQTGDNSYVGGAYGFAQWAVVYICEDSEAKEVAQDVINQLNDLLWGASE